MPIFFLVCTIIFFVIASIFIDAIMDDQKHELLTRLVKAKNPFKRYLEYQKPEPDDDLFEDFKSVPPTCDYDDKVIKAWKWWRVKAILCIIGNRINVLDSYSTDKLSELRNNANCMFIAWAYYTGQEGEGNWTELSVGKGRDWRVYVLPNGT